MIILIGLLSFVFFWLLEKLKNEPTLKEAHIKYPKSNDVNYGASTSRTNASPTVSQEASTSFSNSNKQETKTTPNQTESNVNHIPLTLEQMAGQQILWVNKMYAIHMAKYWQS